MTKSYCKHLGIIILTWGKRIVLVGSILFATFSGTANALSQDQLNTFYSGIYAFDTDPGTACSSSSSVGTTLPASVPAAYRTLFTNAAAAGDTNPQFLAAIFVTEHGNTWPDPTGPWATSSTGASGPFQFEPGTWQAYKTDGDGDGKIDVQNLADSAYSAAKLIKANGAATDTPLGDITHPWQPKTFLYVAGAYNAGGGTIEENTKPSDPLDLPGLTDQVKNYVANVYYLITSGFAHGNPGYGNAAGTVVDKTNGATAPPAASADSSPTGSCSGAVASIIVHAALAFAWDDFGQPGGHTNTSKGASEAKPAYVSAVAQYETDAGSNPAGYTTDYTDCGAFVATVMRASGVDPNYEQLGTGSQLDYVKQHPELYEVKGPGQWDVSDVQPGDIFITDGHTYIYVGKQSDGYSVAEASQGDHVPEVDAQPYTSQDIGSGLEEFSLVRYIGTAANPVTNTDNGGTQ